MDGKKNNIATISENNTLAENGIPTPESLGIELVDSSLPQIMTNMIHESMDADKDDTLAAFDLGVVVQRYRLWKECFPTVRPFYAVKSYLAPGIVKMVAHLGGGFDCASKGEMEEVLSYNVNPDRIIFANTVKFPSHIDFSMKRGVTKMTFDNEDELYKVKRIAPEARLVLRIAPVLSGMVQYELANKFGCSPQDAGTLLKLARKLGLNVVGVSFHVGSGCTDATPFLANLRAAKQVFDEGEAEGFNMEFLDIGGGFYGNDLCEETLRRISGPVNAELEKLFPNVEVISEPGRYFVEASMAVGTRIIGKRPHPAKVQETSDVIESRQLSDWLSMSYHGKVEVEYYLTESMHGMLHLHYFYKRHTYNPTAISKRQLKEDSTSSAILWGPTCDSGDIVQMACQLPSLEDGDWLLFRNVGAYTITLGTNFNGYYQPPLRKIMHKEVWESLQK